MITDDSIESDSDSTRLSKAPRVGRFGLFPVESTNALPTTRQRSNSIPNGFKAFEQYTWFHRTGSGWQRTGGPDRFVVDLVLEPCDHVVEFEIASFLIAHTIPQ